MHGNVRSRIRWLALWAASIPATIIFVPVAGEFFVELAREGGLYKQPSAKVAAVLEVVTSPVESRWFWAAAGLMFGCAIGVWLDALLRRETDAIKRGTEIWCPRTMGR